MNLSQNRALTSCLITKLIKHDWLLDIVLLDVAHIDIDDLRFKCRCSHYPVTFCLVPVIMLVILWISARSKIREACVYKNTYFTIQPVILIQDFLHHQSSIISFFLSLSHFFVLTHDACNANKVSVYNIIGWNILCKFWIVSQRLPFLYDLHSIYSEHMQ